MPDDPREHSIPRDAAASFGGPGWQVRAASHTEDVVEGRLWAPYRVNCEVGRLEAVLLAWPGPELDVGDDPDAHLMLGRVHVPRIQQQCRAIVDYYRGHGVRVHIHRPAQRPPPNYVFMRDLFMMTPEGAVLGRPAGVQRAGEERWAAEALAQAGVPILHTMRGHATFEGADALWINPRRVLLGTGVRTNDEAARQLAPLLSELGVELECVALPRTGVQHLLGVVNLIDHDLAAINGAKADKALLDRLEALNVQSLVIPAGEELLDHRSNNFVTIAPRWVVMPAGCPATRAQLEGLGVRCDELEVGEYVKAAGALGCLTGVLSRG
jgi:N-dimethylarginine dimethylaminohydrolase